MTASARELFETAHERISSAQDIIEYGLGGVNLAEGISLRAALGQWSVSRTEALNRLALVAERVYDGHSEPSALDLYRAQELANESATIIGGALIESRSLT
jgi:hypothetical protein